MSAAFKSLRRVRGTTDAHSASPYSAQLSFLNEYYRPQSGQPMPAPSQESPAHDTEPSAS